MNINPINDKFQDKVASMLAKFNKNIKQEVDTLNGSLPFERTGIKVFPVTVHSDPYIECPTMGLFSKELNSKVTVKIYTQIVLHFEYQDKVLAEPFILDAFRIQADHLDIHDNIIDMRYDNIKHVTIGSSQLTYTIKHTILTGYIARLAEKISRTLIDESEEEARCINNPNLRMPFIAAVDFVRVLDNKARTMGIPVHNFRNLPRTFIAVVITSFKTWSPVRELSNATFNHLFETSYPIFKYSNSQDSFNLLQKYAYETIFLTLKKEYAVRSTAYGIAPIFTKIREESDPMYMHVYEDTDGYVLTFKQSGPEAKLYFEKINGTDCKRTNKSHKIVKRKQFADMMGI